MDDLVKYALVGIQSEILKVESRLKELRERQSEMLKGLGVRKSPKELADATAAHYGTAEKTKRKRSQMSQEARDRMKVAAQARWARVRAAQTVTAPVPDPEVADEPIVASKGTGKRATRKGTTGNRKK